MRCLTLILSFMAAIAGSAFDVESAIVRMESSWRVTAIGKNTDCGSYVICRAEAEVGNDVNIAREQAKLKARTMIAELFSVKVSGSSSRTTITKESAGNDVESFDRSELSKSILRKDIGQVQRGLSVWREKIVGGKLIVYCLLTEQTMDATADLEKTMRKVGPDAVRVKGIGYFNEFVTEAKARVNAIEDAKHNAIADVLGMAMTAFSANQSVSTESVDNNGEETSSFTETEMTKEEKAQSVQACVSGIQVLWEGMNDSGEYVWVGAWNAKALASLKAMSRKMNEIHAEVDDMGEAEKAKKAARDKKDLDEMKKEKSIAGDGRENAAGGANTPSQIDLLNGVKRPKSSTASDAASFF